MVIPVGITQLVFAGCAAFSGLFLLIAVANGALHSHGFHLHTDPAPHGGADPHIASGGHAGHGHHAGHAGHLQHAAGHGHHGAAAHGHHHGHAGGHLHQGQHAHATHTGGDGHAAHGAADTQLQQHVAHSADQAGHDATHPGDHAGRSAHHADGGERSQSGAGALVQGYWHGLTVVVVQSLNLYSILTFLFYFGVTGLVASSRMPKRMDVVIFLATFVGLAAALACGAILHRLFGDTSGLVTHDNSRAGGLDVKVTRRIRDGGTGEIIYNVPSGGTQNLPARSIDGKSIPVGQSVIVVDEKQGIALVKRIGFSLDVASDEDDALYNADDKERGAAEGMDLEV